MAIQLKNIILLFLLFSFVKLDLIKIKNNYYTDSFKKDVDLEIEGFKGSYLKIRVEGNDDEDEDDNINHIISYYNDDSFNERKQLAQSLTKKTVMWLNSKQIKNDFYIGIECSTTPCS